MVDRKDNGQQGGDLILRLHAEVMDLGSALERHHAETDRQFVEIDRQLSALRSALNQHHQETTQHIRRIAEMLMAVGDKLSDHERRLAAVEAKVG